MLKKILGSVAVLLFAGVAWWLLGPGTAERDETSGPSEPLEGPEREAPPPASSPEPPAPPPRALPPLPPPPPAEAEPAPPSPEIVLPPLEESDAFVRARLDALALPPEWSAGGDLVRRLAVGIDGATRGDVIRRSLGSLRPEGPFRVVEQQGRLFPHPDNASRFDGLLDRVERVPPEQVAGLLERLEPLIDSAFAELGSPERGRDALLEAIDRALELEVRRDPLELVRPKVLYEYADPELEALAPLEKQLMRLGPYNLRRLQRYLGRLRSALGSSRDGVDGL